ncbi:MAG: c-type cytochrome, partial [Actinomycetes bacterium]
KRKKIPFWAVPVLAFLPIWAVMYALTLDPPTPTEPGPLALGGEVYAKCAGCHGAGGGGNGAIPALIGEGNVTKVFEKPADQVTWIALGTAGYQAAGIKNYGPGKPVGGSGAQMPAWLSSLTPEELMAVVLHEREALNGETFDAAMWEQDFESTLKARLPADKVEGFMAVLEAWKADPPA